jgi:hypothetical protein
MTEQTKAERLADDLGRWYAAGSTPEQAAAELRRLHALNAELLEALKETEPMLDAMLKHITRYLPEYRNMPALAKVRAAIARAEGKV